VFALVVYQNVLMEIWQTITPSKAQSV